MPSTVGHRIEDGQGFAFIELLIVIIVLGILVAIAVPTYLNERQRAEDASTKVDVRTSQVAMESYGADNGENFVDATVAALQGIEPNIPATMNLSNLGTTTYTISETQSGATYTLVYSGGTTTLTCSVGSCSGGSW